MKTHYGWSLLIVLIHLFWQAFAPCQVHAAESGAVTEREEQDVRQCREQMGRIHKAIFGFYKDHKRLPRFLSDLVPKYGRQQDLTCPAKAHVGDQAWARRWLLYEALQDPKLQANTYSYEFIDKFWQGTTVTYPEYKKAQRDYLGLRFDESDYVPIVRCFMHSETNVLNLTFGGKFVTSGMEWEEKFDLPHDDLDAWVLVPKIQVRLDGEIPPRPVRLGPELLDLSPNYNAVISSSWYKFPASPDVPFGHLLDKPKFSGQVQFDVRGVIQLKGRYLYRPFPLKSEGIKVGQRAQRLHFLLGAYGEAEAGQKIAEIRLNFRDQLPVPFDIVYGKDTLDSWVDPAKVPLFQIKDKVVWTGEHVAENGKIERIRLYDFQRPNPSPNKEILSIDFEVPVVDSIVTGAAPALFAITLEP